MNQDTKNHATADAVSKQARTPGPLCEHGSMRRKCHHCELNHLDRTTADLISALRNFLYEHSGRYREYPRHLCDCSCCQQARTALARAEGRS